jgi:hypothetical protein
LIKIKKMETERKTREDEKCYVCIHNKHYFIHPMLFKDGWDGWICEDCYNNTTEEEYDCIICGYAHDFTQACGRCDGWICEKCGEYITCYCPDCSEYMYNTGVVL